MTSATARAAPGAVPPDPRPAPKAPPPAPARHFRRETGERRFVDVGPQQQGLCLAPRPVRHRPANAGNPTHGATSRHWRANSSASGRTRPALVAPCLTAAPLPGSNRGHE
jgi:hypothetical protein